MVGMSQREIFLFEELEPEKHDSEARYWLAVDGKIIAQTLAYRPLPGSSPVSGKNSWIYMSSLSLEHLREETHIELVDSQSGRRIRLDTQRLLADHEDCYGR